MNEKHESIVAYVPVIHAGYVDFFQKHPEASMHVLDQDVLDEHSHLRKDIRALSPEQSRDLVETLDIFPSVQLLGKAALEKFSQDVDDLIIMPDDEVSSDLHERYFRNHEVTFDPVFLRWHRKNSFINTDVQPDRFVDVKDIHDPVIDQLYKAANKSSNWWRRVGAAIVSDNQEIADDAHNHHMPTAYTPWIDGDPRSNAYRGVAPEATTDQHAEASLIAEAAKNGTSVEGKDIFVTTFPCPPCAKLIAESGIAKCYFIEGYAMTDGQQVLNDHGVEVVKVEGVNPPNIHPETWRDYPEK